MPLLPVRPINVQNGNLCNDTRPGAVGCVGLDAETLRRVSMRERDLAGQHFLAGFERVHSRLAPADGS